MIYQTDGGLIFVALFFIFLLILFFGIGANMLLNKMQHKLEMQNRLLVYIADGVARLRGEKLLNPPIPHPNKGFSKADYAIKDLVKEESTSARLRQTKPPPPPADSDFGDPPIKKFQKPFTEGNIKKRNENLDVHNRRLPISEILSDEYDGEEKG